MKPIILKINEITDSREVYESKPGSIFAIFIYSILGIIIIALTWMYFGRIDVVIKSEGILRPNSQVATIINTYGGILENVSAKDGSAVKEGDILYTVDHSELQTELEFYAKQLEETEYALLMMIRYKQSIEDGTNYFTNTPEEEEFYTECEVYLTTYKQAENELNYSSIEREMSVNVVSEQLELLYEELKYTKQLKVAISRNHNPFYASGEDQDYYSKYLKYQSDYESLSNKYANARIEIDNSITEEGLVNSLIYYNKMLDGFMRLKKSIEEGNNLFDTEDTYCLQYQEYVNRTADLTAGYEQAKDNYEVNKALEGLAVSEWEVQQSEASMEEAKRTIDSYKVNFMGSLNSNITETEKHIEEVTLNKENITSKDKLLEQNERDRIAALENYKLQYIVDLDNSVNTLEDNITNLENSKANLELQKEKVLIIDADDGTEANLVKYRNNELTSILSNIKTYENKKKELNINIAKIKNQIDSAVVKATMSGFINSSLELVEGNYLPSGTEVLNIIPVYDKKYKVNVYVSNEDIGKIDLGMKVKINVYALPNTEYGYLTGTITTISKDLKVDAGSGSAYYLVEAELNQSVLINAKGQKAGLKAGMACQAQMITENKRILIYLLEKLDLWMEE